MAPSPATTDDLAERLAGGDRAALARAITLVESRRPEHQLRARALMQAVLPRTGGAHRLGITGAPGVGKSTLIESLGSMLVARGHRLAVLAVDPSSPRTGGSILGDKTRMTALAAHPSAFVRPSPNAGVPGGVAAATRETILLCEASAFDVVIVETVGVGQSETAVAELVDTFVVLVQPGAGDELQGLKKGVLELADLIVVNKADGDGEAPARLTAAEYGSALRILADEGSDPRPPVMTASALTGAGLDALWEAIAGHRSRGEASGRFEARRRAQQVLWMRRMLDERLRAPLFQDAIVRARVEDLEAEVADGRIAALVAVEEIATMLRDRR